VDTMVDLASGAIAAKAMVVPGLTRTSRAAGAGRGAAS